MITDLVDPTAEHGQGTSFLGALLDTFPNAEAVHPSGTLLRLFFHAGQASLAACRSRCDAERLGWFLREAESFSRSRFEGPTMTAVCVDGMDTMAKTARGWESYSVHVTDHAATPVILLLGNRAATRRRHIADNQSWK